MTNLLWPGDPRAGQLLTDDAVWQSMLRVETAWLQALADNALIPSDASCELGLLVDDSDREAVAVAADDGANPVIAMVALLRRRAPHPARIWIHRGLTSQDVVDTALMLTLSDALRQLRSELTVQVRHLAELAVTHRRTAMLARTLTQPAIRFTFGVKVVVWLNGVCDAANAVTELSTPVQIGGAAGTLAAPTEMATLVQRSTHAADITLAVVKRTAHILDLDEHLPWHTSRGPITAIGDALVHCTDAWARIAADVVTLNRPEIGEVSEPSNPDRGGSSTMPDKSNPVLSILLRRAAITAPPMAAALHTAAAFTNDERADGAWHAEWDTIRILGRRTLVAASHASDLLTGLRVNPDRMATNLAAATVSGEQNAIATLFDKRPSSTYFGASDNLIDRSLDQASQALMALRP